MASLSRKIEAVQKLGWDWAFWRAGYEFRKKSGLLKRRLPAPAWKEIKMGDLLSEGVPVDAEEYRSFRERSRQTFFFALGRLPERGRLESIVSAESRHRTIQVADDFCGGRFLFYGKHVFERGFPPDWLRNPCASARYDNHIHWCDLSAFSENEGDIKDVWEPSRFACAYWLVRAYALSGDEKYPAAFWKLFESWCEQNPPNRGPNWRCGQETAFRLMAWCFALHAFWHSPATTAEHVTAMVRALAFSASRIEPNIDYAVSQKNNHAISEALGLFTVGTLFPELRDAWKWDRDGRRILEREILRQTYEDGSYVQQSMNYHRVMLHDCLWAARLAELNGRPLAPEVLERIGKAAEFLFEMLDEASGRVPNYGPNDGALVLPLAGEDYRDYRATVQAANYLRLRERTLEPGPWDEMLLWLFGADAPRSEARHQRPSSRRFETGGYYTLRRPGSWALLRCHSYIDRPGHVDMLHMDLWHRGVNVLRDSGTYRYFAPREPGMDTFFKDIAAHNTVQVGQGGPLELISRFIWLPWPEANEIQHDESKFVGESHAYNRSPWRVRHRRTVEPGSDGLRWIVTDELLGSGDKLLTLRWQLAAGDYRLDAAQRMMTLDLECGSVRISVGASPAMKMEIVEGAADCGRIGGWMSEYYGERLPAPVLKVWGRVKLPAKLVTTIDLPGGIGH